MCRVADQTDSMRQQYLFDAGMIFTAGGHGVLASLHKADHPLINAKSCSKGALGETRQRPGCAELPPQSLDAISTSRPLHTFYITMTVNFDEA